MRRLLSASFRNRLFAAFLAASLIPLLLCSALLLQIFRLRMEDRAQGEADGYLDSVGQTLDQACRSFSSAAAALERDGAPPRERSTACSWRTSSPPRPWPAWICTTARGTGTAPPAAPPDGACPPSGGCCTRPGNGRP